MSAFWRWLAISWLALSAAGLDAAPRTDAALAGVLRRAAGTMPALARVLATPDRFDLQILWTRIDVPGTRQRRQELAFRLDPQRWFAAASLVKLPLALMALEHLAEHNWSLSDTYLEAQWPIECTPALHSGPQLPPTREPLSRTLRRLLVVSDNEASNRLYQWLGPPQTQDWLRRKGLASARIVRPLMVCSEPSLARLGAWRVSRTDDTTLAAGPARSTGKRPVFPYGRVLRGRAWAEDGRRIDGPHDFTDANFLTLAQMQQLLMAVVRPELLAPAQRTTLRESDRRWLREVLHTRPSEVTDPSWSVVDFPDWYAKFLLVGDGKTAWPEGVRIFNKVGQSYGYLSDVAYIEDATNGSAFFLAATLSVDLDGTLNDGQYAYDEVGLPFLTALGQAILAEERRSRAGTR